ncbi:MAG: hypothetical protein AAF961_03060, partial [Planctomycetota bacterium]
MVALYSSRRCPSRSAACDSRRVEFTKQPPSQPADPVASVGGSRRAAYSPVVAKDEAGQITHVRIGRTRVVAATLQRRITEVRELAIDRIAIRIEVGLNASNALSALKNVVWQLYDHHGRLTAM